MATRIPTINIEDAKFIFRTNFAGRKDKFNNEGERNFNVILEGEALEIAQAVGINVKQAKSRDDNAEPVYYTKVRVGYKFRPPLALLINSKSKRSLTEDTIHILDDFEYDHIDMVIRPNHYTRPDGTQGYNAYLQAIYATVREDPFVSKYYDIPDEDEAFDTDE